MYGGGYIAQFLKNYNEWETVGGGLGSGTTPTLPDANPIECIKALFSMPYGLTGLFVCIVLLVILIVAMIHMSGGGVSGMDHERNLTYSDKGTYGTSGFMTDKERDEILDVCDVKKSTGIILGKIGKKAVMLPTNTRLNRNLAVYGASGSMKSRAYIRNAVLQAVRRKESMILTDPKSELYEDLSLYLQENGYTVRVFNLVNPEYSDGWNCLSEIQGSELMAQVFCDVVIKNTGSVKADHFWDNAEQCLLKALVLYVEQNYEPKNRNIGEVYNLLATSNEDKLNALFSMLPHSHPAYAPYSIFKQASDTVRSGVIIGLASRIQVFQNKMIREITAHDDIDLVLPGKEKCAYFVITSDQDSTFDFLSSLMFSFLFIRLVRYADTYCDGGKLPIHVNFLCDEFPNIGTIVDLKKKISTIRSRNLSISGLVFQNLPQLQNRYPNNEWQEILGNCDVQLFLGCTDEIGAKFVAERSGVTTVAVSSTAKQLNSWRVTNYTPEFRETSSIGKRNVLTPDEVLRLPLNEALIIIRGQKVLKVEKFDYTLHPDAKKLKKQKASDYIPRWRLEQMQQDEIEAKTTSDSEGIHSPDIKETDDNIDSPLTGADKTDKTKPSAPREVTKEDIDSILS